MKDSERNGEQHAFPQQIKEGVFHFPGITKREYIATEMTTGILSSLPYEEFTSMLDGTGPEKAIASIGVSMADALLEALESDS